MPRKPKRPKIFTSVKATAHATRMSSEVDEAIINDFFELHYEEAKKAYDGCSKEE